MENMSLVGIVALVFFAFILILFGIGYFSYKMKNKFEPEVINKLDFADQNYEENFKVSRSKESMPDRNSSISNVTILDSQNFAGYSENPSVRYTGYVERPVERPERFSVIEVEKPVVRDYNPRHTLAGYLANYK
ncbi:MAG: hypothetical protein IAE91_09150 [Ignavibacteriaceae bacterium]|nr:hypothetical protein [Ignavibacteriaceae bacterium]